MSRLVVVSNRAPSADPNKDAGGLVVALKETMRKQNGLWIGIDPSPASEMEDDLRYLSRTDFKIANFNLTEFEHKNYYSGFSNSVLWPAFHNRVDLIRFEPQFLNAYTQVAQRLAKAISKTVNQDDLIWIHDYQLIPLAHYLRKLGLKNTIGFFLHIPLPNTDAAKAIPQFQKMMNWFSDYDLIGLQTKNDIHKFEQLALSFGDFDIRQNKLCAPNGKQAQFGHYPISIDPYEFHETAKSSIDNTQPKTDRLIGVDRLDYTKGLPNRFRAFRQFLSQHPEFCGSTSLLQIAPGSRGSIGAYQDIKKQLQSLSGEINSEYSTLGWTPIEFLHRNFDRNHLAGLFRQSRAALVTPFADGMNLVAKEYIAAQDADDPGTLILSKFAGAAEELTEAVIVNPFDESDMSKAIKLSLIMPIDERIDRHNCLLSKICSNDIDTWSENYLADLTHLKNLSAMGFLQNPSLSSASIKAVA